MAINFSGKSSRYVILVVFFLVTAMTFYDYAKLPSNFASANVVAIDAVAHLNYGRYKTISIKSQGKSYRVDCNYAERLCAMLDARNDQDVSVRVFRYTLDGEYWLVSAHRGGVSVLSEENQWDMYRKAKRQAFFVFILCLSVSVVYLFMYKFGN